MLTDLVASHCTSLGLPYVFQTHKTYQVVGRQLKISLEAKKLSAFPIVNVQEERLLDYGRECLRGSTAQDKDLT